MISLRCSVRFELNKPLNFANVKEELRNSIYRRSLVVTTKGKFLPKYEYDALPPDAKESGYVSPKGDKLKGFLESKPADAAFLNIIYRHVNNHTIEDSRRIIDDYARTEGTTWRVMRVACNLQQEMGPRVIRPSTVAEPEDREKNRFVWLGNALAITAIEQNTEVAMNTSSIGVMWKKLGRPNPLNAQKGEKCATEFPQKMLDSGLWIKHGTTPKGIRSYFRVIRFEGNPSDIYIHLIPTAEIYHPQKTQQEGVTKLR